jgi:hypothetical protein
MCKISRFHRESLQASRARIHAHLDRMATSLAQIKKHLDYLDRLTV